jgi:uncharacterized protein (UPF0264 family)
MQLLVSVRSADEVPAALAGGADIIDAKEPSQGSLGAVEGKTLEQILERSPVSRPLSVALGDVTDPAEAERLISDLNFPLRLAPTYLKLGFAGLTDTGLLEEILCAAVEAGRKHRSGPRIIAVAYGDAAAARSFAYGKARAVALRSGCAGILIDTYTKTGHTLFHWLAPAELARWIRSLRADGLLAALAGGLGPEQAAEIANLDPDVLGVRGSVSDGGRQGTLRSSKVAELRSALARFGLSSNPSCLPCQPAGEKPDPVAHPSPGIGRKSLKLRT